MLHWASSKLWRVSEFRKLWIALSFGWTTYLVFSCSDLRELLEMRDMHDDDQNLDDDQNRDDDQNDQPHQKHDDDQGDWVTQGNPG